MRSRSLTASILVALAMVAPAARALAQAPPGHSARLFGVHDLAGGVEAYLADATPGSCDHGWITHLLYLEGGAHTVTPPSAISLIVRLDWSGSASAPHEGSARGPYADRFVETVTRSPDVHVWIVGNEPNFTIAGGTSPLSAFIAPYIEPFVDNYARVRDRVHAVPGHEDDVVLLPAPSPWSPCFLEGFARIIRGIVERGVAIDGFAIHPGTRHPSDSQRGERVRSDERSGLNCEVGPYTDSAGQYRVFRDFIRVVDDQGFSSAPIYVTESAHNTDASGVVNHADEDRAFFSAMYDEVAAWNASHGQRIRALTPYRWARFGDGSGRDHSMEGKPALQGDHRRGASHTWTELRCEPEPGTCRRDADCDAARALCEGGRCVPARACPCAPDEICRADGLCAPATRGDALITFSPGAPSPGASISIDVFATTGYTNIGLAWEGPLGTSMRPPLTGPEITPGFHWIYGTSAPVAGTYRATFTADPGARIYGVAYLHVSEPGAPEPDAGPWSRDAGAAATADAGARTANDVGRESRDADAGRARGSGTIAGGCAAAHRPKERDVPLSILVTLASLVSLVLARRGAPRRSRGC